MKNIFKKKTPSPDVFFQNNGYCVCCDQDVTFTSKSYWLRDHYCCSNCRSIPRERALMYCVEKFCPTWRELKIHESSPGKCGASLKLEREAPGYIASHYFPDVIPGTIFQDYRCENLEKMTFEDNSIDLQITQDVFEHILDPQAAFHEIARILKPGGMHIFTVPLVNKNNPTAVTARLDINNNIKHFIEKPEYHGNPISEQGSLVTTRWGYDICKLIYDETGLFTEMIYLDILELGIRAEYIEVLITRK